MKVKVYDYDYWVHITDDNPNFLNNKTECGYTDYLMMEIYIRKSMSKQTIFETIIHELTHAYLNCQGRNTQNRFDVEELCEFVGFCAPKIVEQARQVMEEYFNG